MKFKPGRLEVTAALAAGALFTGGCSTASTEHKTATSLINVEHVVVGPNADSAKDAERLNLWLRTHTGKRVVSFTGILEYRSGNEGYELITKPGFNKDEKFEEIPIGYEGGGVINGHESYGLKNASPQVQKWINENPMRQLLSLASIPAYNGGVEEYVILSGSQDAK